MYVFEIYYLNKKQMKMNIQTKKLWKAFILLYHNFPQNKFVHDKKFNLAFLARKLLKKNLDEVLQ